MPEDPMFEVTTETKRGKTMTRFVEREDQHGYLRGGKPLTYHYAHDTGNMRMTHPDLYASREIMARSESGQRAGAKPAVPHDIEFASQVAFEHITHYQGDGLNHMQRQTENLRRRVNSREMD